MRLTHLTLRNFRSYEELELPLAPGHHLLLGPNGAGKTNILEAIHVLGTGSSMRASRDSVLTKHETEGWTVGGRFEANDGTDARRADVQYAGGTKKIRLDKESARASDLLATLKVVSFAPSDIELIRDSGKVRRRFLDLIGCQISSEYLQLLRDYQKAIRQRNETLSRSFVYQRGRMGAELAREPWTDQVVELGSQLLVRRRELIDRLGETMNELSTGAFRDGQLIHTTYKPGVVWKGDDPREAFAAKLQDTKGKDEALGYTTAGPHADDFRLDLGDQELRRYGSLGQQQLSAMFLKLSQAELVRELVGASPILLVDEMFAVLDRRAAEEFLIRVEGEGQIFLATAQEGWLGELRERNFEVHQVDASEVLSA